MAEPAPRTSFVCVGEVDDAILYKAKALMEAMSLASLASGLGEMSVKVQAMLEPEFDVYLTGEVQRLRGAAHQHICSPLITMDGEYLGGYEELAKHCKAVLPALAFPTTPEREYDEAAKLALLGALQATGHAYCYMDFKLGDDKKGRRVLFELYHQLCPRTCENFAALCSGAGKLKYKGSGVHRCVAGGWVAGGDIVSGKGDAGRSVFGDAFEDETFAVKFDAPGVLAMASRGPHTNGSQWFVTVAPLPWLNTKAVAFGRVVRGVSVVHAINAVACVNERPEEPVKVDKCGQLDLASVLDLKF